MPKKKQVALGSEDAEEGSLAKTRSSPPVSGDASYVNSVRIRSLEERNEALKKQVEELERELSQKQEDELDICSHLQRDLAVKSERIAALEDEVRSVRTNWKEDLIAKDAEMEDLRAQSHSEREAIEEEMRRMRQELVDLSSFKENKTLLENELIELRHEVSELKNRHDVEVSDLIRDFDFKYAAVRIQCDRKIDETESSVEERAMQRVDDVTKKAIRLNKKRLILVENLQKEVDYLQSTVERMSRENKTLRTDLEIKEQEIHKLAEKMGQQRQFMNHQGRKLQDQANHESISKVEVDRCKQENAILKSKVVELENKLNVQTRQMQHLQRSVEASTPRGEIRTKLFPPLSADIKPSRAQKSKQLAFLNFIGLNPAQAENMKGEGSEQREKLISVDDRPVRRWFSKAHVLDEGNPRQLSARQEISMLKFEQGGSEIDEDRLRRSLPDKEALRSEHHGMNGTSGSITVR